MKIVIDPGHGGTVSTGGSSWNNATGPSGLLEKDVTLDLALRLQTALLLRGYTCILTRETDVNLGLQDRAYVGYTNRADVFLSIHFNGDSDPKIQGTETWLHTSHSDDSDLFAKAVQDRMVSATGLRDRGVKSKNLGVINPAYHFPDTAACLAEVSFLTNATEEKRLKTVAYKKRVSDALADAIVDYLAHSSRVEIEPMEEPMLGFAEDGADVVMARNNEADAWQMLEPTAHAAFNYWNDFILLRMGGAGKQPLSSDAEVRFRKIIRAVSWVESKHGTAGAHQPKRDPMQCGNPQDIWWKELIGKIPTDKQDRFIRGPGRKNLYASELPQTVAVDTKYPDKAEIGYLNKKQNGHRDTRYSSLHSFYWGVPFLIHKINTKAGDQTFRCGDVSRSRLIEGAVAYNGGGDPKYRKKVEEALNLIGDIPSISEVEMYAEAEEARDEHNTNLAARALKQAVLTLSSQDQSVSSAIDKVFPAGIAEVSVKVTSANEHGVELCTEVRVTGEKRKT